jgi:protection-of-telomeres protein 1
MKVYQNELRVLSTHGSSWTVFHANDTPKDPKDGELLRRTAMTEYKKPITHSQCLYAIMLCNAEDRSTFTAPLQDPILTNGSSSVQVVQAIPKRIRQQANVKDVVVDGFYNLIVQVIKMYSLDGRMTLHVSDYTEHINNYNYHRDLNDLAAEAVARDGDEFGYSGRSRSKTDKSWSGPWGKLTLQLTLFSPHAGYAQDNVREGDWVHVENARIKINSLGNIEAVVHTDQRYLDKITVSVLDEKDDRTKDARRRKREYLVKLKNQEKSLFGQIVGKKRKGERAEHGQKGQKKAKEKGKDLENQSTSLDRSAEQQDVIMGSIQQPTLTRHDVNKHGRGRFQISRNQLLKTNLVRCSHPQFPTRSLDEILNDKSLECTTPDGLSYRVPFQNAKYRARVQVVDFFPSRLQDFAVPKPSTEFDDLSSNEGMSDGDSSDGNPVTATQWRWRFALLVEDGSIPSGSVRQREHLQVIVADEDAEYLLNMDAVK